LAQTALKIHKLVISIDLTFSEGVISFLNLLFHQEVVTSYILNWIHYSKLCMFANNILRFTYHNSNLYDLLKVVIAILDPRPVKIA
jgi:hypothetical protein